GHAGIQTAVRLRELHWEGRIVVVDPDIGTPYERPPLSKEGLEEGLDDAVVPLRKESFYEDQKIERINGTAQSIDPNDKSVLLEEGTRLSYTKLVLALGSEARKLTCPGSELPGILSLKTRNDAVELRKVLKKGNRV